MKKLATLLVLCCVGLIAVGCEGPKADEAKEKMKKAGEHVKEAAEKTGEAVKEGAEATGKAIESGVDALKGSTEKTEETK